MMMDSGHGRPDEHSTDGHRFGMSSGRMLLIGGVFGAFAAVLLVGCNPDAAPAAIAIAVISAAAIAGLTWQPEAALAILAVTTVVAPTVIDCPYATTYLFVVGLAIYSSQPRLPIWSLVVIGIAVFATSEVLSELAPQDEAESLSAELLVAAGVEAVMLTGLVVGLGSAVAIARRQGREMVRLQRQHHDVAMEAERHRIARDLHDTAAHQLSAIVVRSETAEQVGDPSMLREANRFAGESSKEALQAMRQMVSVLRNDDRDVVQPRIEDLDQVADKARTAGVDVSVDVADGVAAGVSRPTELAIVRIVQEALSNVLRHSSAKTASVRVDRRSDMIELRVDDPGPASTSDRTKDGATGTGPGYGVIGMVERAQSVGGTLTAGAAEGGGWRVSARLPLPTSDGTS